MRRVDLTEEQKLELENRVSAYRDREAINIYYKDLARDKREAKGLKFNKITSKEIEMVLHHWLSNGRSNLKRSFQHVYDTTDKTNKEVDWVTGILNSKSFGRELTNAFNTIKHDSIDLVKNSKTFNISRFYNKESLSRRIRQLGIELVYEELLIEKEEKIKELEEALTLALKAKTWEDQALLLLEQGKSQKQVAEELGKGIATISRLVKKVKTLKDV